MIDIRLKVFQSVATTLSFTKASRELFISQPAVSKHIQELEREYDVRLFERLGNHIQLTTTGQALLDRANKILRAYEELNDTMHALGQHAKGELRIGASTTIGQYVVPEIVAKFHHDYPDLHITLLSGNSQEIEHALTTDRIDLGMVEGNIRQPQLKYTPFLKDELVAIVRTGNPVITEKEITVERLKKLPIILREFGSGTLDVLRFALKRQGASLSDLNVVMNLGTTEGIKHYVENSDCLGIVSIRSIGKELLHQTFRVVEIKNMSMSRQFSMVEKRGASPLQVKRFKHYITSHYKV